MAYHAITEALYVIRHKPSNQYIRFGNKLAWMNVAGAKNAWNMHTEYRSIEGCRVLFGQQDEYEVVNLLAMLASTSLPSSSL